MPHIVKPFTDRSPSAVLAPSLLRGAALPTLACLAIPTQAKPITARRLV